MASLIEKYSKKPHERIIVALDMNDSDKASALAEDLLPHVGVFKIGFEFIYSQMAYWLGDSEFQDATTNLWRTRELVKLIGKKAFLDVKLNDIPNTVAKASKAIASMRPKMFNVHASAGREAIKAAAANKGSSQLFGVTVLTSIERRECESIFGVHPEFKVLSFASALLDWGADGVICAPKEGQIIRSVPAFDKLLIACPNVRPSWALGKDDQDKDRQMTPHDAIMAGIDMLVIGRPITNPPPEIGGPVEAAKKIGEEISQALKAKALKGGAV